MPSAIRMATQCLDGLQDTSQSYMRIVHQYIEKFVKDQVLYSVVPVKFFLILVQVSEVSGPDALGSLLERQVLIPLIRNSQSALDSDSRAMSSKKATIRPGRQMIATSQHSCRLSRINIR